MIERFHGIDRHKAYSTISVLDREGREVSFFTCHDLRRYIEGSGANRRGGVGGLRWSVLVGGSDRGTAGMLLRAEPVSVSDHQGLVEQDRFCPRVVARSATRRSHAARMGPGALRVRYHGRSSETQFCASARAPL